MLLVFAVLCLQWIWTWYSTYSTKDVIHSSGFTSVFHMVSTPAELHGKILLQNTLLLLLLLLLYKIY